MKAPPLPNETKCSRWKFPAHATTGDFDRDLLLAVSSVKVRRRMFVVIHGNDDSKNLLISGTSRIVALLCSARPVMRVFVAKNTSPLHNYQSQMSSLLLAPSYPAGFHRRLFDPRQLEIMIDHQRHELGKPNLRRPPQLPLRLRCVA